MNKTPKEIELDSINYLKNTKETFLKTYLKDCKPLEFKTAIFTAGASGSGKTEFAEFLLEIWSDLVHLDIDSIREYFTPLGYDGSNSDIFQKPSSKGIHFLFERAIKKENLSIIMDSNFSNFRLAEENINSLLKRGYNIEIYYFYDDLEKCFLYTKKREAITRRIVPEDVFFNSVIKSRETVIKIKNKFGENISLNLFDKINNKEYSNISIEEFENIVPIFNGGF